MRRSKQSNNPGRRMTHLASGIRGR